MIQAPENVLADCTTRDDAVTGTVASARTSSATRRV
jgi:hypothetical protein